MVVVSWVSLQVSCALDSMPASVVALQLHFSPSRPPPNPPLVSSGQVAPTHRVSPPPPHPPRRTAAAGGGGGGGLHAVFLPRTRSNSLHTTKPPRIERPSCRQLRVGFCLPTTSIIRRKRCRGEGGGKNSPRAVLLVAVAAAVVEAGGDDERKRSKRRRRTAIEGFEVFHHLHHIHPFPSKYRTPAKINK